MPRPPEPKTLTRIREVFGSSDFRRLFTTRTISQIGDGIFQLAAADVLLFRHPGRNPALTLALISAITLIPFSLIGPFVGVFIDRWDRRRILTLTPVVRAVLAGIIGLGVAGSSGAGFYTLVLLVLSANRLFLATISAVLPQTVPEQDLLVANSVASTGGSVANVLGLGIGSLLSAGLGGTRTAGIAAIGFLGGAIVARRVRIHAGVHQPRASVAGQLRVITGEMADGVRIMLQSRRVVYAMSAVTLNQILIGMLTGAGAVFFITELRLGVGAVTSLLGVIAIGIGVGVAAVPAIARRIRHDALIPLAFVLAAIALIATGANLSRAGLVVGGAFVGLAYAMTKIPVDTIVQQEVPDSHRGRAFSAYDVLFNVMRIAGTALAGVAVIAGLSAGSIIVGIGGAYLVASLLLARSERRLPRGTVNLSADEEPTPVPQPLLQTLQPLAEGEMVTVRGRIDAGSASDGRIVIGGGELPIESIAWRAIAELPGGERRTIYMVRAGGLLIRLCSGDASSRWEIETLREIPEALDELLSRDT